MAEFLFDEATHTYTLDGVVIPSVTEICAPITCGKYPPVGVVQQAAARGTRVHELCALYDMDALPDEIEAGLVGYVKAWAAFCRDYKPVWTHIEFPLYGEIDPGQPFAGTIDRIGEIDGRTRVVDCLTTPNLSETNCFMLSAVSRQEETSVVELSSLTPRRMAKSKFVTAAEKEPVTPVISSCRSALLPRSENLRNTSNSFIRTKSPSFHSVPFVTTHNFISGASRFAYSR